MFAPRDPKASRLDREGIITIQNWRYRGKEEIRRKDRPNKQSNKPLGVTHNPFIADRKVFPVFSIAA